MDELAKNNSKHHWMVQPFSAATDKLCCSLCLQDGVVLVNLLLVQEMPE